jgi:anti-anti-sigma factor
MKTVGDVVILDVLPGRVPADVDRLADALAGTCEAPRVIVNLSGIDLVSSLFLARLLVLRRRIQREEGRFILCSAQPLVRMTLASTKLDTIFEVADDEKAALASL